ncbi:unnamed protein product [Urochloa decumbens]|uniref:DUF3615 domain-containing protein n=1 Tax=Urochloa decumbens TaxID=240449 RepID=A0ABC9DWL5_9POAL
MEEGLAAAMEFASPALVELLPDLSPEEQLRLHNGGDACRTRKQRQRHASNKQQPIPHLRRPSERERDMFIIPQVHHALRHYNARHPGAEFDAVKPLMQCRVGFRDQAWFHLNFWARSRSGGSNSKLKRFFAEVHYKQPSPASSSNSPFVPSSFPICIPNPIPIVEVCTIIEEPLSQYRSSCAFCPASYDILHPKGSRKFVCGNDKDRTEQRLVQSNAGTCLGMPFTGTPCG